jgi:hypothetical protein
MKGRRGVLVAYAFTTVLQQPVTQQARWAPPPPCTGDSTEAHARRGSTIAVPNLDSMTILRARVMLARLGLKIDVRNVQVDGRTGVVIGQAPQAGTSVTSGDVVIVCSRRSAAMPNVVGLTFDAAGKVLADAGYDAVRINSFVDRAERVGIVFRQQPVAGAAIPRGGTDTLIVGMAPPIASDMRAPGAQGLPGALPTQQTAGATNVVAPAQEIPPIALLPDEPIGWSWLLVLAVGVVALVAAWAMMVKLKDRRRMAAFRVVPHQHPGRPRVVSATRAKNQR